MARRYLRQYAIRADGRDVHESAARMLRVTFNILVDFGGANTYADIAIYNSSADGRGRFTRGTIVEFLAGYPGDYGTLFKGRVQNVFPERDGASTVTRLICRAHVAPAAVNQTFGSGATLTAILEQLADSLGLKLRTRSGDLAAEPAYSGGYSMSGTATQYLRALSRAHGFDYAYDRDELVILRPTTLRTSSPHSISQFTGMEGIPVITEIGADVDVRLSPRYHIGDSFKVDSDLKTFNFSNAYFQSIPETAGAGEYRIQKIEYSGDTHGDRWTASLSGIRVSE